MDIISTIRPIADGIHIGASTHHQDHDMTLVSLRITNAIASNPNRSLLHKLMFCLLPFF